MNTPPLLWAIDVASLKNLPNSFIFEANAQELDALRRYLDIEDLKAFSSSLKVTPLASGRWRVTGTFKADVLQSSVVNLAPVSTAIEESFSLDYYPSELIEEGRDVEASPYDEDGPEPIVDGRLLVGSLLCELLTVGLDPYPRNEADVFAWNSPEGELRTTPFAKLESLRQRGETNED